MGLATATATFFDHILWLSHRLFSFCAACRQVYILCELIPNLEFPFSPSALDLLSLSLFVCSCLTWSMQVQYSMSSGKLYTTILRFLGHSALICYVLLVLKSHPHFLLISGAPRNKHVDLYRSCLWPILSVQSLYAFLFFLYFDLFDCVCVS